MQTTCVRHPLPIGLRFERSHPKSDAFAYDKHGNRFPVKVSVLSDGYSGSRAWVVRLTVSPPSTQSTTYPDEGVTFVVKSPSPLTRPMDLKALKHEVSVYRFVNELVKRNVCPFFIRLYGPENMGPYPDNAVVTESFHPRCMRSLRHLLKQGDISSKRDALNLLIPLVYTVEVMYRAGLRHNDLHTENIMILHLTKPIDYTFRYRARSGTWKKWTLQNVRYLPLIFDLDRATKTPPQPGVKFKPALQFAPSASPVTTRFPWHNASIRSEKMELHKLFEEIYHGTAPTQTYLYRLMRQMCFRTKEGDREWCLRMKPENRRRVSPLMNEWFFKKYYLPANKVTRREVEPNWVGNAEDYLIQLVKKYLALVPLTKNSERASQSITMKPLY